MVSLKEISDVMIQIESKPIPKYKRRQKRSESIWESLSFDNAIHYLPRNWQKYSLKELEEYGIEMKKRIDESGIELGGK